MNRFELFTSYGTAFPLEIKNLTRDHTVRTSCGGCKCRNDTQDMIRRKMFGTCDCLESESQEGIAGKDGDGFIKLLMTGGSPATKIIVVHCREIIMDERITMNHLDGCGDGQNGFPVRFICVECSDA